MFFKTITVMLLLSCLGASSTALGGKEEPPQNVPPPLIIKDVRWLWTETSTTVQICTEEELSSGQPLLVFDDGTHGVVNVEGVVDAVTTCANFSRNGTHKPIEDSSRYELLLEDPDNLGSFLGRGVTTFAITVSTTLLTCGGSHITKITWTSESEVFHEEFCLDGSLDLVKACYHEGDLMGTEFCFGVNDGVKNLNVCLNGPTTDSTALFDGGVSANYFYYGDDVVNNVEAPNATLSLIMDTTDQTQLRAIVRSAGDPPGVTKIYDCSSTECLIPSYTRKIATYEVCVEAIGERLVTLRTATTTFTDMNLHAFDGGSTTSILVELVFAKALADNLYTAILYKDPPHSFPDVTVLSTSTLDCTGVLSGHACFGFLDADGGGTIVYVALSGSNGTNTIILPYNTNPSPEPRIGYQ